MKINEWGIVRNSVPHLSKTQIQELEESYGTRLDKYAKKIASSFRRADKSRALKSTCHVRSSSETERDARNGKLLELAYAKIHNLDMDQVELAVRKKADAYDVKHGRTKVDVASVHLEKFKINSSGTIADMTFTMSKSKADRIFERCHTKEYEAEAIGFIQRVGDEIFYYGTMKMWPHMIKKIKEEGKEGANRNGRLRIRFKAKGMFESVGNSIILI